MRIRVTTLTTFVAAVAIAARAFASPELLPQGTTAVAMAAETIVTTVSSSGSTSTSHAGLESTSTSTSSSLPFDIAFFFRIGLYAPEPVRTLKIRVVWNNEWTSPDDFYCEPLAPGEASRSVVPGPVAREDWTFDFGDQGLRQSQRILDCNISVWHAEAWWDPEVYVLQAKGPDGEATSISGSLCLDCPYSYPRHYAPDRSDYDSCGLNLCGDTDRNGTLTSADALRSLQASVHLVSPKYIQAWDVNRSGSLSSLDALRILRRVVDLPERLSCAPPPGAECGYSVATTTSTSTTTTTTEEPPLPESTASE